MNFGDLLLRSILPDKTALNKNTIGLNKNINMAKL